MAAVAVMAAARDVREASTGARRAADAARLVWGEGGQVDEKQKKTVGSGRHSRPFFLFPRHSRGRVKVATIGRGWCGGHGSREKNGQPDWGGEACVGAAGADVCS